MKRTPLRRKTRIGHDKPRKPLANKTAKTAARDRRYLIERRKYLEANPVCEHQFPGCDLEATDIDHRIRRSHAPQLVDQPTNFISSCRLCHNYRDHELTREERQELKIGIFAEQMEDNHL